MSFKLTAEEQALIDGKDPDEVPVVEETELEETVAEAAQEEVQPDTEVEEAGKDAPGAEPESWVTDEDRQYAQSYGLGDDELKEFTSREELVRAARIADKYAVSSLKQEPEKKAEEQVPAKPEAKEDPLDLEKWQAKGYEEDTLTLVRELKAEREERRKQQEQLEQIQQYNLSLQQSFAQMRHQERINAFHDALDGMEAEFFGRSVDEKGKFRPLESIHNENRKKVFEALRDLEAVYDKRGQQPPPEKILVQRAKEMVLGEEIRKAEKARLSKELASQSAKRRPVAGSKPVAGAAKKEEKRWMTIEERAAELANDPVIIKAWEKATE